MILEEITELLIDLPVSKSRCASGRRLSLFPGFLSPAFHVVDHLLDTLDNYRAKTELVELL